MNGLPFQYPVSALFVNVHPLVRMAFDHDKTIRLREVQPADKVLVTYFLRIHK